MSHEYIVRYLEERIAALEKLVQEAATDIAILRNMIDDSDQDRWKSAIDQWFWRVANNGIDVMRPATWKGDAAMEKDRA